MFSLASLSLALSPALVNRMTMCVCGPERGATYIYTYSIVFTHSLTHWLANLRLTTLLFAVSWSQLTAGGLDNNSPGESILPVQPV